MENLCFRLIFVGLLLFGHSILVNGQVNKLTVNSPLFQSPQSGVQSCWVSPENPTGEKGTGGLTNKGAKGNAFYVISPGETKAILDIQGAGIIERMWLSGTIWYECRTKACCSY